MAQKGLWDYVFVGIQLLLLAIYAWHGDQASLQWHLPGQIGGWMLGGMGFLLILWAAWQIRRKVTMFPTPMEGAGLMRTGAFRLIRHPIYSGILLMAFGGAWASADGWRFIITGALYLLFYFKSNYEEQRLMAVFPEYREYMQHTGKFIPTKFR